MQFTPTNKQTLVKTVDYSLYCMDSEIHCENVRVKSTDDWKPDRLLYNLLHRSEKWRSGSENGTTLQM